MAVTVVTSTYTATHACNVMYRLTLAVCIIASKYLSSFSKAEPTSVNMRRNTLYIIATQCISATHSKFFKHDITSSKNRIHTYLYEGTDQRTYDVKIPCSYTSVLMCSMLHFSYPSRKTVK